MKNKVPLAIEKPSMKSQSISVYGRVSKSKKQNADKIVYFLASFMNVKGLKFPCVEENFRTYIISYYNVYSI